MAGGLIFVLYESRILEVKRNEKIFKIKLMSENVKVSDTLIWAFAGLFSIVGTILFGIVISKMMRPIFLTRYIYPVSVIAWVILGTVVSKLKGGKLYTVFLIVYLLVVCLPVYWTLYSDEKSMNDKLLRTLDATVSEMKQEDIILTDNDFIIWTIADYYYPGKTSKKVDLSEFPELDKGTCYWLIVNEGKDVGELCEMLEEWGFFCQNIVEHGNLGTFNVSVYQIKSF